MKRLWYQGPADTLCSENKNLCALGDMTPTSSGLYNGLSNSIFCSGQEFWFSPLSSPSCTSRLLDTFPHPLHLAMPLHAALMPTIQPLWARMGPISTATNWVKAAGVLLHTSQPLFLSLLSTEYHISHVPAQIMLRCNNLSPEMGPIKITLRR